MIVLIDNYDSFTYNTYQMLATLSTEPITVLRSKECTLEEIERLNPSRLILSPGPGRPENAGITVDAIRHFAGKVPILGICLGHQAIGYAFGGNIVRAKYPRHGVVESIALDGKGIFRNTGKSADFAGYHSLVIERESLSAEFEISAVAENGEIMGIRHKTLPIEGIQFHPESIASPQGKSVFQAFLNYRREAFSNTQILTRLMNGEDLSRETAELFMEDLTNGNLDERQMAAILTALAIKGPAAEEIAGCASVLCRKKKPLHLENTAVADIVGTGGDGKGSYNVSSMAAIITAACGLPVAKHGNRAVSSKSGSADFYEALGIKLDSSPEKAAEQIKKHQFTFLYAPVYHSAMRYAAPVRKALGIKTLMNLIGPLSNPASADFQMLGVYSKELLIPVAKASKMLGSKRVLVVCSHDGYDEISPAAPTDFVEIDENNELKSYTLRPKDFGISPCSDGDLAGGNAEENVKLTYEMLEGKGNPGIRYSCAMNAGAALYIGKKVSSIQEGFQIAMRALENGSVKQKIEQIKEDSDD